MKCQYPAGEEIRCTIEKEYVSRILLQDKAIGAVAGIKQEVQFIEEFFAIDLNKYMELACELTYAIINYLEHENIVI